MSKAGKKGKIVVISGPSGVGKSTICKEVVGQLDNAIKSVSVTTRPKAKTEVNGVDYQFVSKDEFERMIKEDLLLEYAQVFGNFYGTTRDKVKQLLRAGKTIILEIDVQGGRQVKNLYPDAKMIFILPPTHKDLAVRMRLRGRGEDAEKAEERLTGAEQEIAAAWQYYDHMVINDDLQQAVKEVVQIIRQNDGDK